jgi:OOP family OmpA-OmpF porin
MFKKFAVAAALAAMASSAFAADAKGFYGGLDVGMNKVDNLDGSKIGLGTFLGYRFNQYVALELGYRQLGEWHINGGTVKLSETHVSVVGSYPLNSQFDIYGRLGHDNPQVDSTVPGATYNHDLSGGFFGAGLSYKFTPTISGRIEAQQPTKDSTNVNVAVVFKF